MDSTQDLILERPFLQAVIEAAALLIVLAGWWWDRFEPRRARRWTQTAAAILIVTICGQAAQYFVTTDREYITTMLHDVAGAFERADVQALLAACDERIVTQNLEGHEIAAERFADELRRLFRQFEIRKPKITKLLITFPEPGKATASVSGMATIHDRRLAYERLYANTWRLGLSEKLDRWLIVSVVPAQSPSAWP